MAMIHLIRHGEPVGGKRYRGSSDDALTESGWQQMLDYIDGSNDNNHHWDYVYTSPLRRCLDVGMHVQKQSGVSLVIEPGFSEMHFGDWEGQDAESIMATDAERLHRFWLDPDNCPPPNGETMQDFRHRVLSVWDRVLARHYQNEKVLMITHGGVMRVVLQSVLKLSWPAVYRIDIPYAAVVRIHHTQTRVQWDGLITKT